MKDIYCLAIESSCDETSMSIIKNGCIEISTVVVTQIDIHKKFGGVVPEIASRSHIESITIVLDELLEKAKMGIEEIDIIGVTYGPGLIGSLLIGVECAKTISLVTGKPLIPVHHIAGHIYANNLSERLTFPLIALVVSGGHTDLVYMKEDYSFERIGSTLDDAVGEAYDKVAKILGLDYPGGPVVDKLAHEGQDTYDLPYPLDDKSYNFSFSGIKSAVVNLVHNEKQRGNEIRVADVCTSFQQRVVHILTKKTKNALKEYRVNNLVVAGGVAANKALRASLAEMAQENNIKLSFPEVKFCTDNAAMIGAAAYYAYQKGIRANLELNAKAIDSLYNGTKIND
ncbi:MAG: tRNA (adenosine(37)-N6)-threonylcarbamoyltransferase complex transferase subunit TsaD [Bacilli bacterium]|nr:tRNA (adenosine(37)-N6)-threonylcarbamoyltransferase complex transferase subunit TsaD [Bacilli bacterium]